MYPMGYSFFGDHVKYVLELYLFLACRRDPKGYLEIEDIQWDSKDNSLFWNRCVESEG